MMFKGNSALKSCCNGTRGQ